MKKHLFTLLLFALFCSYSVAQNSIKGTVLDQDGEPLYGANILIENSSRGTTTDENGQFELTINQDLPVNIVVSYIGFATQTIEAKSTDIDTIVLQSRRRGVFKPPVAAGKRSGDLEYDIVPGRPDLSILFYRMKSNEPAVKMPEVGRSLAHREGLDLIESYIKALPNP